MPSEEADEFTPEQLRERHFREGVKLGYLSLAFWPFMFIAALMSGDAPGSGETAMKIVLWVIFAGAVPFLTHVAAEVAFAHGHYTAANRLARSPMIVIAVLFVGAIGWSVILGLLIRLHLLR